MLRYRDEKMGREVEVATSSIRVKEKTKPVARSRRGLRSFSTRVDFNVKI